ncbi:hypothetical protein CEXT_654251 [Caerostris extrusa]|uniref:Uncharacterized protein n=1 Tax=Caerostris extrusa TaxID=172846 RepID=A0AAV4XEH3_CAEEX|nr:hypothetical protein CEXT_654251 [Caerostris extrusa]
MVTFMCSGTKENDHWQFSDKSRYCVQHDDHIRESSAIPIFPPGDVETSVGNDSTFSFLRRLRKIPLRKQVLFSTGAAPARAKGVIASQGRRVEDSRDFYGTPWLPFSIARRRGSLPNGFELFSNLSRRIICL